MEVFKIISVFLTIFYTINAEISVEQKLKEDSDLSQFYDLLMANSVANISLQYRQVTLFAPTNAAFQRYHTRTHIKPLSDLVLYHMSNLATTVDTFGTSISSEMDGNPPLWVTIKKEISRDHVYINNAKVLIDRSNFIAFNSQKKKQVLHVIDQVLEPVLPSQSTTSPIYNPNAYQLINQSESIDIGSHRVRFFRQKIADHNKKEVFNEESRNTFFIPVDEGFNPASRAEMIDDKVIDGHVVPGKVLFIGATHMDEQFETLAFGDMLKVTVSFTEGGEQGVVHVRSNTLLGDGKHASGVVLAQIVKANIPVKNGVVHLISRPLMVVDTSITEWLETQKNDGPAQRFWEVLNDSEPGKQFFQLLNRSRDLTLFVPSNHAWQDDNLKNLVRNPEKMREIFNLHLVRDRRLSVESIKQINLNTVQTAADRKHLYFNVVPHSSGDEVLTVEGGGVNATCVQANIAATNGIIHIIDRVLGVPQTTVLDKLRQDPMLNDTYHLGVMAGPQFYKRLNQTDRKYTFFVPRDKAWRKTEINMPSVYKKLFMPQFSYHNLSELMENDRWYGRPRENVDIETLRILEHHLVVSDFPYTMERMKKMVNDTSYEITLPSLRGDLRFRIEERDKSAGDDTVNRTSFTLIWGSDRIHVFRPDVECTNGVIHVIDAPFLQPEDIKVVASSGSRSLATIFGIVTSFWLLMH